jgi:formylglycine-generating enzyme required for sulfatase activity
VNKISFDASENMVYVKGGCFQMGDIFGDGWAREKPVHEVCVNDFYLGKYEITVGEFRTFVLAADYQTEAERQDGCHSVTAKAEIKKKEYSWQNAGFLQTDQDPVVCITWNDAQAYIRWLNAKQGVNYRLPTEAEWEYAARSGGKNYKYSWGNSEPSGNIGDKTAKIKLLGLINEKGYDDGYPYTSPVGSFKPNELGVYDMSGNVYEWLADWLSMDYYNKSPRHNPKGPESGHIKVLRGGSWNPFPGHVYTTSRRGNITGSRGAWMGFRLAHPAK